MNSSVSYPLNGADRFQLFFDAVARRNTGTGNVIRAAVTVSGLIPQNDFLYAVQKNEAIRLLTSLALRRKWFSPLYMLKKREALIISEEIITFHSSENSVQSMEEALTRDCNIASGTPLYIDVIYEGGQTVIIFSASHVLMDYAGMEILLASFAEPWTHNPQVESLPHEGSFLQKLMDALQATFFVASLSGWNIRRLARKGVKGKPALELMELTEEETQHVRSRAENEIQTNALSFYLGCSVFSISQHERLLTGKGDYFVAVPVDRRPVSRQGFLPGNFISFLYFHAKTGKAKNVRDLAQSISEQLIMQARAKIPKKFTSLLSLFRFIPTPVYRAFIDLPSNGNSGTFAFSLLANSGLEGKFFLGIPVTDVTHYPPVISPPGLNIVFTGFGSRLKIILSFDEGRIKRQEAMDLLYTIRKNLAGGKDYSH